MQRSIVPRLAGLLAIGLASSPALSQSSAPQPACTAPEHRQFDFWVGYWDVYPTGKDKPVAHSLIEKLYGDCVVRENWMPMKGTPGGSLNTYEPDQRRWHQTWMDASNARVAFDGGLVAGKMILQGFWKGANGPGKDGLVRMTYSKVAGDTVRQFGEISTDHGLTWAPFFDFTYRKSPSAPPK